MIKCSIHQENIIIPNFYVRDKISSRHVKKNLTKEQGEVGQTQQWTWKLKNSSHST